MKKIIKKLKYVSLSDIFAPVYFFIAYIPAIITKWFLKKELWLICEDGKTARDNGICFFEYLQLTHPEINVYYVIDKKSSDFAKIKQYNKRIIQFKSLKHWYMYIAAKWNISNHKHGNPCQSFWGIVHVYLNLFNNRIFLQHGVIKDDLPYIYYKNSKFKMFICSAEREYKYVLDNFGYPEGYVQCTGIPRFDKLVNTLANPNNILIMPTWRSWFGGNSFNENEFIKSSYFKNWSNLLNDKELSEFLEVNNITVYFYQHQHMQKYSHLFNTNSKKIQIIQNNEIDIQELLIKSSLLVTDYSSVFMDFGYMEKPVIYFHFDYENYRKNHLSEGYFNYNNDGFGEITKNLRELVESIKRIAENSYSDSEVYVRRRKKFFSQRDNSNCERIFLAIKERDEIL